MLASVADVLWLEKHWETVIAAETRKEAKNAGGIFNFLRRQFQFEEVTEFTEINQELALDFLDLLQKY